MKNTNTSDKKENKDNNNNNLTSIIKSKFIIGKIFSILNQTQKLYIIKYSKKYQNLLDINIEDYINYSGKYIIGGKNWYGKVLRLDNNQTVFEGEYINKKKNGIGLEYFGGKIIFRGNYKNNKRNGKGIEYTENNKISFEGFFMNGKRNGKGKEYENGHLKFEGEYLNGKIWNGKEFIFDTYDNLIYEVEYLNGEQKTKNEINVFDSFFGFD